MDNQQQNCNLKYKGKVIKQEHLIEIYNQYIEGKSLSALSKEYNYNIGTIRGFLMTNNVTIRDVKESVKPFHKQNILVFDDFLKENLIGWILGDGGLRIFKNSINPIFNYTDKHKDYIDYVSNILTTYNIKHSISFNKNNKCYQLQSETRPEFLEYYNMFYGYIGLNKNGQKRKILPNIIITPIILRNWFIGDGSSVKISKSNNHRGSISCKYRNEFILEQLNKLFDNKIKCYEYKSNNRICYQYHIPNKSFIKFLNYIGECPVNSYKYKWITRCSTTIIEASENDEGIV